MILTFLHCNLIQERVSLVNFFDRLQGLKLIRFFRCDICEVSLCIHHLNIHCTCPDILFIQKKIVR